MNTLSNWFLLATASFTSVLFILGLIYAVRYLFAWHAVVQRLQEARAVIRHSALRARILTTSAYDPWPHGDDYFTWDHFLSIAETQLLESLDSYDTTAIAPISTYFLKPWKFSVKSLEALYEEAAQIWVETLDFPRVFDVLLKDKNMQFCVERQKSAVDPELDFSNAVAHRTLELYCFRCAGSVRRTSLQSENELMQKLREAIAKDSQEELPERLPDWKR